MAHKIDNCYQVIDKKEISSKGLSELYVFYNGKYYEVAAGDIKIITKRTDGLISGVREIKNTADLKSNLKKLCVYDGSLIDNVDDPQIYHKGFLVPSTHDYTSQSFHSYGLKRTANVEQVKKLEGADKVPSEDSYLYVQIGNDWTFVRPNKIYWYDGATQKTYIDAIIEGKDVSTINFFDDFNKEIGSIYTEYEYKYGKIIKKEVVDFDKLTTSMVEVEDDGTEKILSSAKINGKYSDQEFVKLEVQDEKKPGKTKTAHKIKTTNYQVVKGDDENLFVAVKVNDSLHSHVKMVKIADLTDENGDKIENISLMIGKRLKIKENGKIVASTEPLTYEQANLRFDTIKSYQETNVEANDNTCLRLKDGTYVKELETVQPRSYKVAVGEAFDKFLVKQKIKDLEKWVVVDKNYFTKHGNSQGLDRSTAIKIIACNFNDKNCSVVQITSSGEKIEQCGIIKKIAGVEDEVKNKKDLYDAFKVSYKTNNYAVDEVYINGQKKEVDAPNIRYEYTDKILTDDHAEDLQQYKALKTKDLSMKNGEIVGGGNYDIGKGIASSFSVWGKVLAYGYPLSIVAGFFIPVVGPIVAAACSAGLVAAIPGIPIGNMIYGAVKNRSKTYVDKTEYNRAVEVKQASKAIEELFKESLNKDASIDAQHFENKYSAIMNKILALSQTTSNNSLKMENGSAKVDSNNVNLANEHKKEYNKKNKRLERVTYQIEKLKKKGKSIPESLQNEFDALTHDVEQLKNSTIGTSYAEHPQMDKLKEKAETMKLIVYLKNYKDSEIVQDALSALTAEEKDLINNIEFDLKKGLLLDGFSLNVEDEVVKDYKTGKGLYKSSTCTFEQWINIKHAILNLQGKINNIELDKPKNEDVEKQMQTKGEIESIYQDCLNKNTEIQATLESVLDYKLKNIILKLSTMLETDITSIYEAGIDKNNLEEVIIELTNIQNKQTELLAVHEKANHLKDVSIKVDEIKTLFDNTIEEINNKEANGKSIIETISTSVKKKEFADKYNTITSNFADSINKIKLIEEVENYENLDELTVSLENEKTNMDSLLANAREELTKQDINLLKAKVQNEVENFLQSNNVAQQMFETIFQSSFNVTNVLEKMAESANKCKTKQEARVYVEKANYIALITESTIGAFNIVNKIKTNSTRVEVVKWLDNIRIMLSDFDLENAKLEEVKKKSIEITAVFEKLKPLEPSTKVASKTRSAKYDSASAQAESDLLRELVDKNSSIYTAIKDIIIHEYEIQDKYDTGPNAREKAAEKAILNFVTKSHDYLRMGENLDKKFKTGMNKIILANGNMLMANIKGKTA